MLKDYVLREHLNRALNTNRRSFLKGAAITAASGLVTTGKSEKAQAFAYQPYPTDDELETVVTSCAHNCGSRHALIAHKKGDVIVRLSADDGTYQRDGYFGELERFILNENEVRIKTKIWMAANADYLQEQKEKEEREAKEKEEAASKPEKKKKKTHKRKSHVQASTAGEAIRTMLQEKKISSKINYEVLKDLCQPQDKQPSTSVTPAFAQKNESLGMLRLKRPNIVSQPKPVSEEEPSEKKQRLEPVSNSEVVIESGPVQYESGPIQYIDDGELEEDEEEVEHLSAAQLMGHGQPLYGEYDDPYDIYD